MAERKKLLAGIGCREGSAVLLNRVEEISNRSLNALAHYYNDNGADELLFPSSFCY